ncbi:tRNA (N6-isopentenyl adenosine(37)-C2)-methylthiotransferase MiaB [Patescibacteria group bacterium]|nr:tRNA (N6-isopentenyl adenosine(37)-C2)-methylthiotransferase MiaB [Patescibacteria group bacterium]MBU1907070.1 tRNA (N6-isopentenyl adenosine(37)-C2)-methylthiotransferase MiaB [Patescibacteria group bacterium]
MAKKYHIVTYGCQMNKNDSERIAGLLSGIGMECVEDETEADLVLLNSCSVRQTAEDRIFGKVKTLAKLRKTKPDLLIGVTGCMAGRDKNGELRKKLPRADLFFGTEEAVQLPRWIAELRPNWVKATESVEDFLKLKPHYHSDKQAFVTIQTGCSNFCTYCVVPFARGTEKNRPLDDIMTEVRGLASSGCLEITLLGQVVNAYVAPDPEGFSKQNPYQDNFAALLWEINQIEGIERIFFTAPHPRHMTDEQVDALALPKMLNYLHLPVQSGNDEILKKMNRKHTREEFDELIRKIKARVPGIALGTDIIVGFCGETEEQFQDTVEMYKDVEFDISYTAQYSPRSGTAAFKAFKDDVSREEKKRRWQVIQNLMEQTVLKKNQRYIGKTVSVLVESCEEGVCAGNSREMKVVQFWGEADLVGTIQNVKIDKVQEWILYGKKL